VLGAFNGERIWGIYKLENGELKICVSIHTTVKAPKADSGLYLVTLKRR